MKELEKLKDYLESKIKLDFNFNVEHWDSGNFDDSFNYGVDCGEQYAFREILTKVNKLLKNEEI